MRLGNCNLGCSALLLSEFGEKQAGGYTRSAKYVEYPPSATNFPDFKAECLKAVSYYQEWCASSKSAQVWKQAVVVAYTISEQPLAEEFLEQLGFTPFHSGEYMKYKHVSTVWCMACGDFLRAIGAKEAKKIKLKGKIENDEE